MARRAIPGLKVTTGDGTTGEVHFKLSVVGESGVGKSQLVRRLQKIQFNPAVTSTIKYDQHTLYVEVNNTVVVLDVWDTAGQERFRALSAMFFRQSYMCLVVYSITDARSFDEATYWLDTYLECEDAPGARLGSAQYFNVALIGTKSDLNHLRQVPRARGEDLAERYDAAFAEVSSVGSQGGGELERTLLFLTRVTVDALGTAWRRLDLTQLASDDVAAASAAAEPLSDWRDDRVFVPDRPGINADMYALRVQGASASGAASEDSEAMCSGGSGMCA